MELKLQKINAYNRDSIPEENATIEDDLYLDMMIPLISNVEWYFRSPEACPFARGNWMLDLHMIDGSINAFKFPKEMKEEQFVAFIKPLLDRMIPTKH